MNIELIILAAVAVFVISRLYAVLGQRSGVQPPPRTRRMSETPPAPAPADDANGDMDARPRPRPTFSGPAAKGLEAIAEQDASFNPDEFVQGARRAYEVIVGAFADGDREALQPLLDTDVFETWSRVISEREATGQEPMRLLRLRSSKLVEASVDGEGVARVSVSFEGDLGDGESVRKAREIWTFKRQAKSDNPNWLLDEVAAAS